MKLTQENLKQRLEAMIDAKRWLREKGAAEISLRKGSDMWIAWTSGGEFTWRELRINLLDGWDEE